MNKRSRFTLFALCVLLLTGYRAAGEDMGIYLLAQDVPGDQLLSLDLSTAQLDETPVVSLADIVSYTWATHEIEVTADAYARVQSLFALPIDVDGIPFVMQVGDAPAYAGGSWSLASSLSFDGPTITQPFDPDRTVTTISFGYRGEASARGGSTGRPGPPGGAREGGQAKVNPSGLRSKHNPPQRFRERQSCQRRAAAEESACPAFPAPRL